MKYLKNITTLMLFILAVPIYSQVVDYKYTKNQTYTYQETHEISKSLAHKYKIAEFKEMGKSDAG